MLRWFSKGPLLRQCRSHFLVSAARIIWSLENAPATAVVFAQTIIEIAATADKVWSLWIDCIRWPNWYKHCSEVSIVRGGPLLDGSSKFRFKTLRLVFEPEITMFEPARILVWMAKGPLCTRGAHAWYIEPTAGRMPCHHRGNTARLVAAFDAVAGAQNVPQIAWRMAAGSEELAEAT